MGDPYYGQDPTGTRKITPTLPVQSANYPKTKLNVDAFRKWRMEMPDWRTITIHTSAPESYPRWANIGHTSKVMPFEIPIAISLRREAKQICVIDPTNSHFYENVSSPEEGIFYDVAEEVRKNIHYAIKCCCPDSSTCTCSDGWTINFVKCRENLKNKDFRKDFDSFVKTWDKGTLEPATEKDSEPPKPILLPNWYEAMSIVHCENCGRDEDPENELKRCGRCQDVRYCSLKCQKRDWPRHKKGCLPPMADIGGGVKLVPIEHTTLDPVTQELTVKMAKKKPKLERKVKKNEKKGKD